LGVTVVNLPAYRPELKGSVEKFFDLIQSSFKPYLKGCGTIEPDFQERGSHDYRKDARLTLQQFESIMVRCILHYNTQRIYCMKKVGTEIHLRAKSQPPAVPVVCTGPFRAFYQPSL
jgi:hypothetical protein